MKKIVDVNLRIGLKLSHRAQLLLRLIDSATEFEENGKLKCYWLPKVGPEYIDAWTSSEGKVRTQVDRAGKVTMLVDGAGDARILRSLADKRLTVKKGPFPGNYFFAITEQGRLVVEALKQHQEDK